PHQQQTSFPVPRNDGGAVNGPATQPQPLASQEVRHAIGLPVQRRGYQVKHVTACRAAASSRATGKSFSPRAAPSNSARFSPPRITNSSSSASSSAGIVSVIRSNGASGGSGSGVRRRTGKGSSARGSALGNSEATCPSPPMPSHASANRGGRASAASDTTAAPAGSNSARIRPVLLAG